jgi:PadR family transcriptional regulator PadR
MSDPIVDAAARKGSAEMLILAALEDGELHGYAISRTIAERSDGVLTFRAASLYPLLYRLEGRGWIEGHWHQTTGARRRRSYRLTRKGHTALGRQRTRWASFIRGLGRAAGLGRA